MYNGLRSKGKCVVKDILISLLGSTSEQNVIFPFLDCLYFGRSHIITCTCILGFNSIWKTSKIMRTEWEELCWIPQNATPIIISPSKAPTQSPLVTWRPSVPSVSWWCGCWSRGLVNSCLSRYCTCVMSVLF